MEHWCLRGWLVVDIGHVSSGVFNIAEYLVVNGFFLRSDI